MIRLSGRISTWIFVVEEDLLMLKIRVLLFNFVYFAVTYILGVRNESDERESKLIIFAENM